MYVSKKGDYIEEKWIRKKKEFIKLHIAADAKSKKVISFRITRGNVHDAKKFFLKFKNSAEPTVKTHVMELSYELLILLFEGDVRAFNMSFNHLLLGNRQKQSLKLSNSFSLHSLQKVKSSTDSDKGLNSEHIGHLSNPLSSHSLQNQEDVLKISDKDFVFLQHTHCRSVS